MLFNTFTSALVTFAVLTAPIMGAAIPVSSEEMEAKTFVPRVAMASDIVSAIEKVTAMSQDLQPIANSITIVNGPLIVIGQGPFPKIISEFTDIYNTVSAASSMIQGTQPFSAKSDQDAIVAAYVSFVKVHQQLLNILIGKAGLFSTVPFVGQPVAAVLRNIESIVDSIALSIVPLLPNDGPQFSDQTKMLDGTLSMAVSSYDPTLV